jgi:hypothetical protein
LRRIASGTPTPSSHSRRLITLFSCIRPDVPIRTRECPIGCTSAPQRNENCSEVRPGQKKRTTTADYRKRKECHSQQHPPPTRGFTRPQPRETTYTAILLAIPLLRLTPPSPENRICQSKLDSPALAVVTAPGPSSTWGWVARNFICSSVKESCQRNSRCSSAVIFMVWKGFLCTGQSKSKDIKRCHKKMTQEQFRLDRRQGGNDLKKPGEQGCRRVDAKGS